MKLALGILIGLASPSLRKLRETLEK